jgi:hypothetical protein
MINTKTIHRTISKIFQDLFVKLAQLYHSSCSSSETDFGAGGLAYLAITSTSYAKSLAGLSTKMVSKYATIIKAGV